MGHTFGVFTNSQKGVTFGRMKAQLVDDQTNPNHPDNPESPNQPRGNRHPSYQNPILGDDGIGKIGRFQSVSIDALEVVIEQMIEQYLRDKSWYGKVRCREALWNMYHRIEWWVRQQIDPSKNDYQRVLQMMKDCINHILVEAQDNVSLPLCPVPYFIPYHGDYFNHFDGKDVEVKVFDSRDLPKAGDFPGMFRYVSSAEDQEWEVAHSTGSDESQGDETILKLSMDRLLYGNSSKVTFNWRFKKRGFIRFKYLASTAAGNGLTFFINNNQVGGEWSGNSGWQEVKFNVYPGQTYKFDWLARKQNEKPWGKESIYIKDIECVEVIRSLDAPTPPDFDTLGTAAYRDPAYEWVTYSKSSVIRTDFDGLVTDRNRTRRLSFNMENECDGQVSFAYRMGVATPQSVREYYLMFIDNLISRSQTGNGRHGSTAMKTVDTVWAGNGNNFSTTTDAAKISYELTVGPESTLDAFGTLEIICPTYEIDHYEPAVVQTTGTASWFLGGNWQHIGEQIILQEPTAGPHDLITWITIADDGWFTFSYSHDLRPSESFEVLVDGLPVLYSINIDNGTVTIPLAAGGRQITFRITDTYTEQPITDSIAATFVYGERTTGESFTVTAPLGSKATITRNWDVDATGASTTVNGDDITNVVTLNPGASFRLDEVVAFYPNPSGDAGMVTEDNFNDGPDAYTDVQFSPSWEWEDFLTRVGQGSGDGIYKVEGVPGMHTAWLPVNLSFGGRVQFEYGGRFGSYDYVELIAGSTVLWRGNRDQETPAGSFDWITVPLPAGAYTLYWNYYCQGGSVVTIPPDTEQPTNPRNEVCYTSGSETTLIENSQASAEITTERTAVVGWGGTDFYTGPNGQAAEADGATILRNFKAPSFGSIRFTERLQIKPGANTPVNGLYPVDVNLVGYAQNRMYQSGSYYSLDVGSVIPPGQQGWVSPYFSTEGQIHVSFDYLTFLKDTTGHVLFNKSGLDTKYRAEFNVYLVPAGGAPTDEGYRKLQVIDNTGIKQKYNNITNWTGAKTFALKTQVPAGEYYLLFLMNDVVNDYDRDAEGNLYYAAFRNLKVNVSDTRMDITYDNTRVKVELVNLSTNAVEQSNTYSAGGTHTADFSISFIGQPNVPYQVRYTLLKGNGTTGGHYGRGGSMQMSAGSFRENWSEYCTSNGNYYPKSESTQRPPADGTTVVVPETPGAWAWLDTVRVYYNYEPVCTDSRVEVSVQEGGVTISNSVWDQFSASEMFAEVTNNSTEIKTYTVRQTYYSSCGAGARLSDGRMQITDMRRPQPAYAMISDFSITNNHPVWMGGCDGSTMTVTVTDEVGGLVSTEQFSGDGLHSFAVSNLQHSPYSKYTIQIETDQKGVVSPVTGKPYLTTFRLVDFKVYEDWLNVPDPFNGKLEFFIDGTLVATYTGAGGFFTASYPITKGPHMLEWVFTELGTGNTYDRCEIDFLQVTNWICDKIKVVPYCQPGGGDKCVEELIKCLLKLWNDRPKACVIGKMIWLFT